MAFIPTAGIGAKAPSQARVREIRVAAQLAPLTAPRSTLKLPHSSGMLENNLDCCRIEGDFNFVLGRHLILT
jgi:hypothetical protein